MSKARQVFFWTGLALLYLSLHTRLDYYAERMFFIHRAQHLVLHHLAPMVVMAAFPGSVMRAGLPLVWRARCRRFLAAPGGRALPAALTHRVLVPCALRAGMVLVWLIPAVQFYTMLDWRLYRLTELVGGNHRFHVLEPHPRPPAQPAGRHDPGGRVISPVLTMTPQMIAGAVIAFTETDIYPLFALCGRAVSLSAQEDQMMGGLTMRIPAALVEVVGLLIALGTLDAPVGARPAAPAGRPRCRAEGPGRQNGVSPPARRRRLKNPGYSGIRPWYLRPMAMVAWNMPALLPQS